MGPGIASMTTDYRNGVDVMTTETTCLSSIWATDEDTHAFLTMHGRGDDYRELKPADVALPRRLSAPRSTRRASSLSHRRAILPTALEIDELNENLRGTFCMRSRARGQAKIGLRARRTWPASA
ncbi:MAG: aconitase family protein [Collinsella sp.]